MFEFDSFDDLYQAREPPSLELPIDKFQLNPSAPTFFPKECPHYFPQYRGYRHHYRGGRHNHHHHHPHNNYHYRNHRNHHYNHHHRFPHPSDFHQYGHHHLDRSNRRYMDGEHFQHHRYQHHHRNKGGGNYQNHHQHKNKEGDAIFLEECERNHSKNKKHNTNVDDENNNHSHENTYEGSICSQTNTSCSGGSSYEHSGTRSVTDSPSLRASRPIHGKQRKYSYRSKQNKINVVLNNLKRKFSSTGKLAHGEVLRGDDTLRIDVKRFTALQQIEKVIADIELNPDIDIVKADFPVSQKNRFQKKGFIAYLKCGSSEQANLLHQELSTLIDPKWHDKHLFRINIALDQQRIGDMFIVENHHHLTQQQHSPPLGPMSRPSDSGDEELRRLSCRPSEDELEEGDLEENYEEDSLECHLHSHMEAFDIPDHGSHGPEELDEIMRRKDSAEEKRSSGSEDSMNSSMESGEKGSGLQDLGEVIKQHNDNQQLEKSFEKLNFAESRPEVTLVKDS